MGPSGRLVFNLLLMRCNEGAETGEGRREILRRKTEEIIPIIPQNSENGADNR